MIKAIALDDEPLGLTIIEAFCKKIDFIELEKTFTEPAEALRHVKKFPVDLIFLDVRMPSMSGIDFYKTVPQNTMVIFTTAFSEYAVEGFNLSAVDFLLKPFEFSRFQQAVNKAKEYYNFLHEKDPQASKYIFLRADYSLHKIDVNDILFIEGLDNYLKVHLSNAKAIIARMSMKSMVEKLSPKAFLRVHRSFIVPISKVEAIRNKNIYIGEHKIPIGTNYTTQVEEILGTKG
ncbi:MAG: response regulator transcription factor [Sphingobacteriales bacterium]|nr:MAG: response regulator transcription factor [Sphingobacteriales bacterium]